MTGTGLIGRLAEVEATDRLLTSLGPGSGVLEISGEPGIGKSSLLADLAGRADDRGFLVLEGRAAEFDEEAPFAVFVDALDDYLGSVNLRALAPLGEESGNELARIFPSLGELAAQGGAPVLQDERYRAHHAVRGMLEALASRKPLVLALDDLHWADEASLELLSHLVRRRPRAPVLIALAYRDREASERLTAVMADAAREGEIERLRLGPLNDVDSLALLGGDLTEGAAGRLYRESGGNPFYLEQLARAAPLGSGVPADTPDEELPATWAAEVPVAVLAAIDGEVAALGDTAATLLRGAAVCGEAFEPDLAAASAGLEAGQTLDALDRLVARDLVRQTQVPRLFAFRHPIVRRAVYEGAPSGWRLAAHERADAALAARGATALQRARHVECWAPPGNGEAIAVLTAAGHSAAPRAPAAAAHWFAAALRLIPENDAIAQLGVLVPSAMALASAGRFEEALTALRQLLAALPADQRDLRARAVAACSRIEHVLGRHGEAHHLLTGALEELPDRSSPEATALKLELSADAFFSGRFGEMRPWLEEALADADLRADRATQAAATGLMGSASYLNDQVGEAREWYDRADQLTGRITDDELSRHLLSHTWSATGLVFLERFKAARRLTQRAIALAESSGQAQIPALVRIVDGLALIWTGQLDAADQQLDASIEASRLSGNRQAHSWALWVRSFGAILSGDLRTAIQLGERGVEVAGPDADPVSKLGGAYLARARFERGDPAEACRDQLLSALGGPDLPPVERAFKAHFYEALAQMELAAGKTDASQEWVERAEAAASGLEIGGRDCDALRARASLELARGDAAAAAEHGLAAIEAARRGGVPIEEARARIVAGRALGETDPVRATAELEEALKSLEALGSMGYRDEAAAQLRKLGRRVRRPTRRGSADSGVEALSGRELEIASLVSEGKTNKEIAGSLFLSEKTIESHLSRIFTKLGVAKRAQVAREIERERLR